MLVPRNLSGRRSRRTSPTLVQGFLNSAGKAEPVLNHPPHDLERSLVLIANYPTLSRKKLLLP